MLLICTYLACPTATPLSPLPLPSSSVCVCDLDFLSQVAVQKRVFWGFFFLLTEMLPRLSCGRGSVAVVPVLLVVVGSVVALLSSGPDWRKS